MRYVTYARAESGVLTRTHSRQFSETDAMQTITRRTYPDGTRATYKLVPGSDAAAKLLMPMKPLRTRLARSENRLFPKYAPGIDSTADYVRRYFALNSQRNKLPAYPDDVDPLALYAPLPDAPAAVYAGVDSVETIEGGAE